jgi:hypothetical protein
MAPESTPWDRGHMTEYRAFDKKGALISHEDLAETDSAVAWGMTMGFNGAALIERKAGEDWVCFVEYLGEAVRPAGSG